MLKKIIFTLSLFLVFNLSASSLGFETMPYSKKIKEEKIIVQEFFFHGCPHCKRIEKPLKEWLKTIDKNKIKFEKLPVNFGGKATQAAKHYYAAEVLGKEKEFSDLYFKELVNNRKEITDELAIKILKSIGEREDSILEALNSYAVNENVNNVRELTKEYRINRVPVFIVNGNVKVDAETAGSEKAIFDILDKITKN